MLYTKQEQNNKNSRKMWQKYVYEFSTDPKKFVWAMQAQKFGYIYSQA